MIGAAYGVLANIPSVWASTLAALVYGFLGVLVGVPVAFTVNMVRHLRYFFIPIGLMLALLGYHILR